MAKRINRNRRRSRRIPSKRSASSKAMAALMLALCLVVALVVSEHGAAFGPSQAYGLTGDCLPPLLKAAAKKSGVDPANIVLIRPEDAAAFYEANRESVEKYGFSLGIQPDGGFSATFVIGPSYPIYVNGVAARPGELPGFEIISSAYDKDIRAKFFDDIYAASLRHEKAHAEGQLQESLALEAERQYLLSAYPKVRPPQIDLILSDLDGRLEWARKAEAFKGPLGSNIHLARASGL